MKLPNRKETASTGSNINSIIIIFVLFSTDEPGDKTMEITNQTESNNKEKEEILVNENNNLKDNNSNQNNKQQLPVRKAPPVPPTSPPSLKNSSDQRSNHSYEEIAASEVASEVHCSKF